VYTLMAPPYVPTLIISPNGDKPELTLTQVEIVNSEAK